MSDLRGLQLTKSERIIVVALSYVFCAPLFWANGKKLVRFISQLSAEARRQIQEEEEEGERREARREQQQAA